MPPPTAAKRCWWVRKHSPYWLDFTEVRTSATIHAQTYRVSPTGQKSNPSQLSVWELGSKFWIN